MPINVLINGAFGRMGQLTAKAIAENPADFLLVGQTGRDYDLKKAIDDAKAEVVVDFTHPDAVFGNTLTIIEAGAHPVIGTSGLTQEHILLLKEKCAHVKLGGIIAPNFSLGAVLMMKYAKEIIKYLPSVEIIEKHHEAKVDSPSGTALRSAELIANALPRIHATTFESLETIPGARGANYQGIPIHAIRLPGLLAHQEIIFGNKGETLTLSHNSIDRQCFMPGVMLACKKVVSLDHLFCGLEELI